MKLKFVRENSLPQLSWCAFLLSGSETVAIYHGSMVETNEESFFEGAWDAPFEDHQFHQANAFSGSGGVLTQEGLLFASATNLSEQLYSVRVDHCLYISNSLVFLLAQLDDGPDPAVAHYFFDFLESFRRGLTGKTQSIRTRRGKYIKLHSYCNLLIGRNLTIDYRPKQDCHAPKDYGAYRKLLEGTLERILANATHPNRLYCYPPITTISQGYDSVAVAALAAKAGCQEAVTFTSKEDARAIGVILGLMTKEYDLAAFQQLLDYPEAEFYTIPFGTFVPFKIMEPKLRGKLLLTGLHGGLIWDLGQYKRFFSNLRQPWRTFIDGNSLNEFRLRVGFFHLPLPYVGAVNAREIHQISRSDELRFWSIGGQYDRPIPRRIAEDAGVPRHLFGQKKMAGAHFRPNHGMSRKSRDDFMEYCERNSISSSRLRPSSAKRILGLTHGKLCNRLPHLPYWMVSLMLPLTWLRFRNWVHPLWNLKYLYTFHWGVSKIRNRYVIPQDI
jgi:hypothetical protein